jgi:hypothetical protein
VWVQFPPPVITNVPPEQTASQVVVGATWLAFAKLTDVSARFGFLVGVCLGLAFFIAYVLILALWRTLALGRRDARLRLAAFESSLRRGGCGFSSERRGRGRKRDGTYIVNISIWSGCGIAQKAERRHSPRASIFPMDEKLA